MIAPEPIGSERTAFSAETRARDRVGARIICLLTGRLPRDSIHCLVDAFGAAAAGDAARAEELVERARQLSVAAGVHDPVRLVEVPVT